MKKKKFIITDLFVFINSKIMNEQESKMKEGELGVIRIAFNARFGNLKITLHEWKDECIIGSSFNINKCPRITTFSLYPEHALSLLNAEKQSASGLLLIERLFNDAFVPNKTYVKWAKDKIRVVFRD